MSKQFAGILAVIVLVLGGIFLATSNNGPSSSSSAKPTNHVEGSTSTGVKLIEYGDYECPFCGQFYPLVKQIAEQYKDQIQVQFRNLPLTQIHKNAFAGARAAEAAALQNKFWQMHDTLYENQDPNGKQGWVVSDNPLDQYFVGFATTIGLNIAQFKTDYASSKVNDAILADLSTFKKTGLDESTPTFFLDGKQIKPTYSITDFQKAIDTEIKAKTGK